MIPFDLPTEGRREPAHKITPAYGSMHYPVAACRGKLNWGGDATPPGPSSIVDLNGIQVIDLNFNPIVRG